MRRATLLILLSASLLASPVSPGILLDQIRSFLTSITSMGSAPDQVGPAPTVDAGCGLDPDGRPRCAPGS
jgi:hypothetical protein